MIQNYSINGCVVATRFGGRGANAWAWLEQLPQKVQLPPGSPSSPPLLMLSVAAATSKAAAKRKMTRKTELPAEGTTISLSHTQLVSEMVADQS